MMGMRSFITALRLPHRKIWFPLGALGLILLAHIVVIQWAQDSLEFIRLLDADNEPVMVALPAPTHSNSAHPKPTAEKKPSTPESAPSVPAPVASEETTPVVTAPSVDTTTEQASDAKAPNTSISSTPLNNVPEKMAEPELSAAPKANTSSPVFEQVSFPPSAELRYNASATQGTRSLSGSGSIVWQHDGQNYTIKGEASALLLSLLSYQSSGQLGKAGILPDLYYEKRIGKSATQTHFVRARNTISFSASTASYEIRGGEQDRGSIIWQLVGLARGDSAKLEPGLAFESVIAGSKAADRWRVNVIGKESLMLTDGTTSAWHLALAPLESSFDYQIDIWLSPDKDWYPVKIMYANRSGANLTMTLEKLQQK